MGNFGEFTSKKGGYKYNKLPNAGKIEYLYKTNDLLLKVDQFGIQTLQHEAPSGIFVFKRELREAFSPTRVYFELNGKVYNNFDTISCDNFEIEYEPTKAIYSLTFGDLKVVTTIVLPLDKPCLIMDTTFENTSNKFLDLKVMPVTFIFMTSLNQAAWDKLDWYTITKYDDKNNKISCTHLSPEAKKADRRYLDVLYSDSFDSVELSLERLTSLTKNYSIIPDKLGLETTSKVVYGYEQVISGKTTYKLALKESKQLRQIFVLNSTETNVDEYKRYFNDSEIEKELKILDKYYDEKFTKRSIKTSDEDFNSFVNQFLPLEIDWVASLDRGWGTGLRGVRDAANDFLGYIVYNKEECKKVIETIISKQRDDGWYPRQVPFNGTNMMDLRQYVDSSCFFFELVYEYICFYDDYTIFEKEYPYYNNEKLESGFEHILKGVEYLMKKENLGQNGLVRLQGGDWLDPLGCVGKNGKAETVMVSAQMILTLKQFMKILDFYKPGSDVSKYEKYIETMKDSINKASFNKEGFYRAVFGDDENWYMSEKDVDGKLRVYAPTNCYCLLTDVAKGKEDKIIKNLESLKTKYGYKLFSVPFGDPVLDNFGKMGSGDFPPYLLENGSVYNHGSQCFYLRALGHLGDYKRFGEVLKFALPVYREESVSCAAKYALTNCYQLVPSFEGRTMFSFLTGSIAMGIRAIYNWMFGIQFEPKYLMIKPCVPEEYKDSVVEFKYKNWNLTLKYSGFGSTINSVKVNGKSVDFSKDNFLLEKSQINSDTVIEVVLG